MAKNTIQEERIKGYFIDAAMEILRGEGITNLSVRNVAEKAGYSYATLYNYFKDINELLSSCIAEFLKENKNSINAAIKYIPNGEERIKVIYYTYIKYFIQYPGIFDLIYSTKLSSKNSRKLILSFLEETCDEDWKFLISNEIYSDEEVQIKKDSIKYIITGLLLLYNNLQFPDDYEQFQLKVKTQIDTIL